MLVAISLIRKIISEIDIAAHLEYKIHRKQT